MNPKDVEFNNFYYTYDEFGTLVGRWVDNTLVFVVSTLHRIDDIVKNVRRKPRITQKNKAHVEKVWGKLGKIIIGIPKLIDDYNHWMGGVDLADQRIAYYMPDLCCC